MKVALKNNSQLLIRDIVEDDAASMLEYLKAVGAETDYLTFGGEGAGYTLEEEIEFIRKRSETSNMLFIAGVIDGRIIATLGLLFNGRERVAHTGEFGMTVRKQYWNCGIGSAMIDYMLDWADKRENVLKINLQVRVDNVRAINLYLKKGFLFEGRNRAGMKVGDDVFDFYYMGKVLKNDAARDS